jgi:hypothetical protein
VAFHVVIERPRGNGPDAVARLAEAVSERYGIPVQQLRDRLAAGKLRVKSNVDVATAETFAKDLESLGAVCAIVDAATGEPVKKKTAPSSISSGLSAAYTPEAAAKQDLGALQSGEFALSTLDGKEDQVEPEQTGLPASFGPPAGVPPSAAPLDLFAPPDSQEPAELVIETVGKKKAGKMADAPPPPPTEAEVAAAAEAAPSARRPVFADIRIRFAAGVLLAILIGFVPATLLASMREGGAYDEIDRGVRARYQAVYSDEDWNALDGMLVRERIHKEEARRNIALGSLLVWALAGAGVAFVWFRVVSPRLPGVRDAAY